MRRNYEEAPEYAAEAYVIRGHSGVAWNILGWETVPDVDTQWSSYEARTGNLLAVMIGDDQKFSVDPADVTALPEDGYCQECGQIGCGHGRA